MLAASGSSSVLQPLFGVLSDRHHRRWLLPAAALLAGAGVAGTGLTPTYPATLAAVAAAGVGTLAELASVVCQQFAEAAGVDLSDLRLRPAEPRKNLRRRRRAAEVQCDGVAATIASAITTRSRPPGRSRRRMHDERPATRARAAHAATAGVLD
jgi:MFS family permease